MVKVVDLSILVKNLPGFSFWSQSSYKMKIWCVYAKSTLEVKKKIQVFKVLILTYHIILKKE